MRKKIYLTPIVSILVLSLSMATKQLIADSCYRMAGRDGKELNNAIGYLEKCVAIDSKRPLFHFSLGRAYLRMGLARASRLNEENKWIRKSIDEFHRAVELEPSNSDYHFHLGIGYGSLPYPPPFYWDVTQNSFKRTAILNPTDIRYLYSIGMYYLSEYDRLKNKVGNTSEIGVPDYKKYAVLSKDNYQLYFKKLLDVNEEYLAKILEKCFIVTQSYTDLRAVIRDTPNDHVFLARFLNNKNMWKEAKKEFMAAINLETTNPLPYFGFAHAFFSRGDFENAIDWWQKQKALNPRDGRPYLFSARSFMRLKRFGDAVQELQELVSLYPENINYRIEFIRILIAADRVDEAIDEYRKIARRNPKSSREFADSIRYYQSRGNYSKATKTLNEALSSLVRR